MGKPLVLAAPPPSTSSPGKKPVKSVPNNANLQLFDDDDALGGGALGALAPLERIESTAVNRESATHAAFAASRRDASFVVAPALQYVRVLNDYCQWDRVAAASTAQATVLVVLSQPGHGKSALLAHWAAARQQRSSPADSNSSRSNSATHHDEFIYEHYAGCSYDSVRLSLVLYRFMHEIKTMFALRDFELPREHEEEKLKFSLARCLEAAVGRSATHLTGTGSNFKRIILVLDGIDCIRNEDGGDSLSWLPTTFPPSVRIIVSATQTAPRGMNPLRCCKLVTRRPYAFDDDGDLVYDTTVAAQEHDSHTIRELRRRHATFIVVESLDELACRAILQLYEDKRNCCLDKDERDAIVAAAGSSSPLYVRLLLHALELFEAPQASASTQALPLPQDVSAANTPRKQWLRVATQTNELHVVYELLLKQWNALLLADLYDQFHRVRATAVAATTTAASELETLQTAIEQRALLVRHVLSLLAVARYGLSDADIVKLIGDAVPKPVCLQLLRLLRPHLMQIRRLDCSLSANATAHATDDASSVVLLNDLSHNQLRLLVRYGFLRDDHLRQCYYREVANYFEAMDASQRRVDELPVQLERCGLWSPLQSCLVDMRMFQLWWHERNRQEFFAYWTVLRVNSAVHDPVDDFVRSLDDFVSREAPSADQLFALVLTITAFLRTWWSPLQQQRGTANSSVNGSSGASAAAVLNRPAPPQLDAFIASLSNFSLAHVSARDAQRLQSDIDALCIHANDDGYFVKRWLWTQFPLLAIAFETRFLRNVLASRFAASSDAASAATNAPVPAAAGTATSKSTTSDSGVVLPKTIYATTTSKATATAPTGKRKPLGGSSGAAIKTTPLPSTTSSTLDSNTDDDFGAFEFLSPEHVEDSIGSAAKLEAQLVDLRMRYDKLKFVAKEKSASLAALESRLVDVRAQARAAGQSASKMEELHEQIRVVGDETLVGRQRSDYYKAILRHCELNPARDPNTIESAECVVRKLKTDVVELQQRAQVVAYEKRLASIEVPKLLHVLEERAQTHAAALARLRWRQELNHRMTTSLVATRLAAFSSGSSSNESNKKVAATATAASPDKRSLHASSTSVAAAVTSAGGGRRTTATDELSFLRVKDKLLHKKETSAERQSAGQTLTAYVGSAYKDDGILGALRHVGINKPEDAIVYWQDQLEHATQLEAEEQRGAQRVSDSRDRLAALQTQFVSLTLSGSSASCDEPLAAANSSSTAVASASSTGGAAAALASVSPSGNSGSESVQKAQSAAKLLEQQLADATASNSTKRDRAARLKVLTERLHLGLLHIAQIVGVASATRLDALALGDAIEQCVRLVLGDESHLSASSSASGSSLHLRRKNSARVMGLASHGSSASGEQSTISSNTSLVALDARSAADKQRFNVRVTRASEPPPRGLNPYVDSGADEEEEDEEEENEENEEEGASDSESELQRAKRISSGHVRRRQDIKDASRLQVQRKETEKKRADKRRK